MWFNFHTTINEVLMVTISRESTYILSASELFLRLHKDTKFSFLKQFQMFKKKITVNNSKIM